MKYCMLQHATVRFKIIDDIMVEHSLESLPLLVILLVLHAQHHTLLSIEDLESHLISELLKGICKYYNVGICIYILVMTRYWPLLYH